MAAFNVRGQTIHSQLDIYPCATGDLLYKPIGPMKFEEIRSKFRQAVLIIVDEVSLYHICLEINK